MIKWVCVKSEERPEWGEEILIYGIPINENKLRVLIGVYDGHKDQISLFGNDFCHAASHDGCFGAELKVVKYWARLPQFPYKLPPPLEIIKY